MPVARYDAAAEFYVERADPIDVDPAGRALLELLPDVTGRCVLDLACGHGRLALELARRGARVTGLDLSAVLLDRARGAAASEGLDVEWIEGDAASSAALVGRTFDGVASHFGLTDIDDLDGALETVGRVLRPGGWFVFSILHPCFPGRGDDAPSSWQPGTDYFDAGWWMAANSGFRGKVGSNHRMLSTYVNALVAHGLGVERMGEPRRDRPWRNAAGGVEDADAVPTFLVVRCRRS